MTASLAKRYGIGCGDNSCVWGSRGGMSTNGGCRCFDTYQMTDAQRADVRRTKAGIAALWRALAENPDIGAALDQLVLAVWTKDAGP